MTKQIQISNELADFLKAASLLERFLSNCFKSTAGKGIISDVDQGFRWAGTTEGRSFWEAVSHAFECYKGLKEATDFIDAKLESFGETLEEEPCECAQGVDVPFDDEELPDVLAPISTEEVEMMMLAAILSGRLTLNTKAVHDA